MKRMKILKETLTLPWIRQLEALHFFALFKFFVVQLLHGGWIF